MYILLEACEKPAVLRLIWFGNLFFDLLSVIIPIGLIVILLFDFTKAVVNNDDATQSKINGIILKRIMYAIVVFTVPWDVSIVMKMCSTIGLDIGEDYETCISTVRSEKFDISKYDEAYEKELAAEKEISAGGTPGNVKYSASKIPSIGLVKGAATSNLMQCNQAWSSTSVCTYDGRTICSAGCGFTSLTMVLRSLGYVNLTPDIVVGEICRGGYGYSGYAAPSDFVYMAGKYGLKSQVYNEFYSGDEAEEKLMPHLKNGHKLIINMPGHYISVIGFESDGYLAVRDSARGFEYGGILGKKYKNLKELFADTSWSPYVYTYKWLNATAIYK